MKIDSDTPSMSVNDVEKDIIVQGNLKPLFELYDKFDDVGKRILEVSTVKYLNTFNRSLVEIMSEIRKSLYNLLEMRRVNAKVEEERLK